MSGGRGKRYQLLSAAECERRLAKLQKGWSIVSAAGGGRALQRRFEFGGFEPAFAFMARVAPAAEQMDHHPDWSNSYNRVDVSLSTHAAGGLTKLDFQLAAKMDQLLSP